MNLTNVKFMQVGITVSERNSHVVLSVLLICMF